jgi:hypothetical protein
MNLVLQELNVLRPMTHESVVSMVYDDRYTPLLKRANLATVAHVCRHGVPPFNPTALTTMIDRWRPETHSFHLPCGEMIVILQDNHDLWGKNPGNPGDKKHRFH